MNFRKAILCTLLGLIFCLEMTTHSALADLYLHSWQDQQTPKGVFRIHPGVGYFTSTTNFDDSGTAVAPVTLNSYKRVNVDALGAYGLSDRFTFFGRIEWSAISLSATGRDSQSYGLADQTLGANYRLFGDKSKSGTAFDLQLQADMPTYTISSARSDLTPALGDQSVDVTSGAFLRLAPWKGQNAEFHLTVGGGFTWRSSGYAPEIPWSVLADYLPSTSGMLFGIGAYGLSSMGTDSKVRSGLPGSATGGSFMSEGLNPSLAMAKLQLGYRVSSRFDWILQGAIPIMGKSSPRGNLIALTAEFRLGGSSDEEEDPLKMHPEQYRKSNKGFVEYTFEAKVTSTNDRLSLVKMNKGSESGVEEGQIYDLFKPNSDGTAGKPVARAIVKSVKTGETVLSIKEYFKEVWIEEGFIVKRPIQ